MAYEKLLNEIYAVVSLKYLWPEYQPYFIKSESPDWMNETMDLGLEVSQALLPDDGQEASFIEHYLGCRREELPASALERKLEKLNTNYQHRTYNGLYLYLHPADQNDIDAGQLFEFMDQRQQDQKKRFDWVFLNCGAVIYVCNYRKHILETVKLPQNAEDFLNDEAERLRHSTEWKDGTPIE